MIEEKQQELSLADVLSHTSLTIMKQQSTSMRRGLTAVMAMCLCTAVWAEPAGFVKTVTGQAQVITDGQTVTAQPGTPIHQGSTLRTAAGSSMGVTLRDNTVMSFGPDTELRVDEFVFQPTQGRGRLATRMNQGTMNYVSGAIARLQPEAVSVATPTGTIGTRGTQFLLKVSPQ